MFKHSHDDIASRLDRIEATLSHLDKVASYALVTAIGAPIALASVLAVYVTILQLHHG
jgi:hypothetical protein